MINFSDNLANPFEAGQENEKKFEIFINYIVVIIHSNLICTNS